MHFDLKNISDVASRLDEDGVGTTEVIFMSRKPEAKAFKRWVTSEVLPSIRKHDTIEDMIAALGRAIETAEGDPTPNAFGKILSKTHKDRPTSLTSSTSRYEKRRHLPWCRLFSLS